MNPHEGLLDPMPSTAANVPENIFGRVVDRGGGCVFTESGAILVPARTVLAAEGRDRGLLKSYLGWDPAVIRDMVQFPPDPLQITQRYLTEDPHGLRVLPQQLRSMSVGVEAADGSVKRLYTKGNMIALSRDMLKGMQEKVFVRKISGGQLGERAVKQFQNAATIQEIAYDVLGRPTYAPIPLQVVEYDRVYVPGAGLTGLVEFFGKGEHMSHQAHEFLKTWVRGKFRFDEQCRGVRDAFRKQGMSDEDVASDPAALGEAYVRMTRPAVFNYLAGADMRVGHVHSDLNTPAAVLRVIGAEVTPESSRDVVEKALSYIFNVHGLDPALPGEPDVFTDSGRFNPPAYMDAFRSGNSQSLANVVESFCARHGEVVGLCHGAGYELGAAFVKTNTGGATAARNVAVDGSIMDLDPISHERDFVGSESPITGEHVSSLSAKSADIRFSVDSIRTFASMLGVSDASAHALSVAADSYEKHYVLAAEKYAGLGRSQYGDELSYLVEKLRSGKN